jgi:eukaryotic-like serine/threonine-protein kinase
MSIIGQTLGGHYQVLNFLGKGGFGETYLAKDLHLPDKPLRVIKRLQSNFSPQVFEIAKKLFDKEANVLYSLNHAQIPKLFAHFEENKHFYLVQEYIEGEDLSKEIFLGKQLREAEVTKLLQEILQLLTYVHNEQKIIHRDIKPSNLMRRASDGRIILIDFGAVKQISSQIKNIPGQGISTVPIQSPGYTPYEQIAGNPQFCSDIYALGIVAIQALTGSNPAYLSKDNNSEIIWQDKASVTPKLAKIIDKMVRYKFEERYRSTVEVLHDFSSTTIPCDPPLIEKPKNQFNFKSVLLGLGLLATLTSIVIAVFSFLQKQAENNSKPTNPTIELQE